MRKSFLSSFFLAGLCFLPLPVHSQSDNRSVTVSGDVMTAEGNRRVEGASVRVTDSAGNQIAQEYTNSAGIFRFVRLRRSTYILKVSADGFQPSELHVDLSFSSDRGITFYLKALQNDRGPASAGAAVSSHELSLPESVRESLAAGRQALYTYNKPSEALNHFEKALKKAPGCYEAKYESGIAYLKLQKTPEAMTSFRQSLKLSDGKFGDADIALGTLLLDQGQGQSDDGEKLLREGIVLSPGSWVGFYEVAKLEVRKGNFTEAETSAGQACSLAPNVPMIYQLLSVIHLRLQNYPALLQDIDNYLQLDSTSPAAGRARQVRQEIQVRLAQSTPNSGPSPHVNP
jgi:tetratricopeptide (TPR) repeat protein